MSEGGAPAGWIVTAALVLFVMLRGIVIAAADLPTITPDEYGSWAMARYLAGHDSLLLMQDAPRYSLVSGLVLTPITWLPGGPVVAYRLALVVLSCCTVGAAFLLRAAVRRLVPGTPLLAGAAFALVLLWPATFVTGSFTWAEPTVVLWWALLVWAAVTTWRAEDARTRTTALLVGAVAAGLAPFVHGRFVVAPAIWLVVMAAFALERRNGARTDHRRTRWVVGSVAALLGLLVVTLLVDRAATGAVWTEATSEGIPSLLGSATSLGLWRALAVELAGQIWYVLVSSAGLAAFGVAMLVRMARRTSVPGSRATALTLAALLGSNLLISSAVIGSGLHAAAETVPPTMEIRWDHLVFGRYVDAATLVLAVLGVVWLWDPARRTLVRIAAGTAGTATVFAAVVAAYAAGVEAKPDIAPAIAGVSILIDPTGGLPMARWTVCGLVGLVLVSAAAWHGRRALLGVLGTLLVLGCLLAARQAGALQRAESTPAGLVEAIGVAPTGTDAGGSSDAPTIEVATDAVALPDLNFWRLPLQHQLLYQGWRVGFSDLDSDGLARSTPTEAEILVLTDGNQPPGDRWTPVAEFEGAIFWRRG